MLPDFCKRAALFLRLADDFYHIYFVVRRAVAENKSARHFADDLKSHFTVECYRAFVAVDNGEFKLGRAVLFCLRFKLGEHYTAYSESPEFAEERYHNRRAVSHLLMSAEDEPAVSRKLAADLADHHHTILRRKV